MLDAKCMVENFDKNIAHGFILLETEMNNTNVNALTVYRESSLTLTRNAAVIVEDL